MKTPKVSVIMSVYNSASYLSEAIESILRQTFTDFEFIIVDDCSKDDSSKIINKFSKVDRRIRVIKNTKNKGLVFSLNYAIEHAKAPIIARMDSDDIALETRIEVQYEYFKEETIGLISTLKEDINEVGEILIRDNPNNYLLSSEEIKKYLFLNGNILNHPTVMFRKSIFNLTEGYRKVFEGAEDYDLWLRMSAHTSIVIVPEILLKYRRNTNSVTISKAAKIELCARYVRQEAVNRSNNIKFSPLDEWKKVKINLTEEEAIKCLDWLTVMRIGMNMIDVKNKKAARWYLMQTLKLKGGLNKSVLMRYLTSYMPYKILKSLRDKWRKVNHIYS